jgi:hypothetical protein
MPGIYVNDGGAMSSSLGSALGRLAGDLSPQAQAQAQLLQQETIKAMWANRLAQAEVPAEEQGISAGRALAKATGSEIGTYGYTPPSGPVSPNATPAPNMAPAAPPGSPANTQQDSMSPGGDLYKGATNSYHSGQSGAEQHGVLGDLMANMVARGKGAADLLPLVNLGQQKTMGPGNTWSEQAEIARTRVAPFNKGVTETRVDPLGAMGVPLPVPPGMGAPQGQPAQPARPVAGTYDGAGGPTGQSGQPGQPSQMSQPSQLPPGQVPGQTSPGVWGGMSPYAQARETHQADLDTAYFGNAFTEGNKGQTELQKIDDMRKDVALMHTGTLVGRAWTSFQQHLLDEYGISAGDSGAAQSEINKRIVGMIGDVRDEIGNTRGGVGALQIMLRSLPNAMMDRRVFSEILSSAQAAAWQKTQVGDIAKKWMAGQIDPVAAREQISQIYAHDPTEGIRAKYAHLPGMGPPDEAVAGGGGGHVIGAGNAPATAPAGGGGYSVGQTATGANGQRAQFGADGQWHLL